ncbi:MAG: VWA domain-containing protein [Chitinophagaceae bacterium]|nr:MAG: VWA domain-containing protein [Chitinophagaceae bacterium]
MEWANPEVLWLGILPCIWLLLYFLFLSKKKAFFNVSNIPSISQHGKSIRVRLLHFPVILRFLGLLLLITALARPQSLLEERNVSTEVVDIVISLDISGSMLAEDFEPNRLEAAKNLAYEFIDLRKGDRIGLVIFAGEAFTQVPLTTDHAYLKEMFDKVDIGFLRDGTAIGDGLATSVNRLKNSSAKSKVVVLLTDGVNNRGFIDPLTAAEIAASKGIRVYTIGVGSEGTAPFPFQTPMGVQYRDVPVEIDEELCKQIAQMTGGKYFRAIDEESMSEIYEEIDRMERTTIDVQIIRSTSEEFFPFLLIALGFLVLDWFLRHSLLRTAV